MSTADNVFVLTIVGCLCDHAGKKIPARTAMRSRNHDYNILGHSQSSEMVVELVDADRF